MDEKAVERANWLWRMRHGPPLCTHCDILAWLFTRWIPPQFEKPPGEWESERTEYWKRHCSAGSIPGSIQAAAHRIHDLDGSAVLELECLWPYIILRARLPAEGMERFAVLVADVQNGWTIPCPA